MAKESKVILKSSNGHLFEVDESVAFQSQTIKNMIEDTGAECAIPLPDVSSMILGKVIEYCQYHVDAQKANDGNSAISESDVKNWDADFVKVDQATLFDLVLAADYLNIKNLLVLTCQTVEDMTKSKTAEEIHKMLTEWASEPKMSDLDI